MLIWPSYVDDKIIKNNFLNKEASAVDAIKGWLDDVTIEIHCLKDPNYTMILLSSHGTLELANKEKTRSYQENNQNIVKKLNIQNKFIIIISTGIQLMPTTLQEYSLLSWKKNGKQQDGPVECFVFCWWLQRWILDWPWQTCITNLNVVIKSSGNNFEWSFFKTRTNYNPSHRELENHGKSINQTIVSFHCPKIVYSKNLHCVLQNSIHTACMFWMWKL